MLRMLEAEIEEKVTIFRTVGLAYNRGSDSKAEAEIVLTHMSKSKKKHRNDLFSIQEINECSTH